MITVRDDNGQEREVPLIGVSGPSGCGKSTLTKELADRLGMALYASQTRKIRAKYGLKNHADVIIHSVTDADHLFNFQSEVLDGRSSTAISEALGNETIGKLGVIADRTPLDSLVYFLFQSAPLLSEEDSYRFLMRVILSLVGYDLIVVLEPLPMAVEDDGERIPNKVFQMASHWLFRESIRFTTSSLRRAEFKTGDKWTPIPTIIDESALLRGKVRSVPERVKLVTDYLEFLKSNPDTQS